jgi:hypothetical protein
MRSNYRGIFPDAVSDETAVALSTFLTDLAAECERRYLAKMMRYRANHQPPCDPDCPWKHTTGDDPF